MLTMYQSAAMSPVSPTVHHQQQSAGESRESWRGWCGGAARHTEARCRSRSWCGATPTTDNWLLHNLSYHHHSHTTTYLAFRTCTGNYFLLSIYLHPFLRTLSSMMLYCMITISRTLCTTALPPLTPALLTYSLPLCFCV